MTEGKPSFLGPWRGQIVTGGPGGEGLNGGYNVSGQSWITVDFVTGEVSGIMTPDTITAASSTDTAAEPRARGAMETQDTMICRAYMLQHRVARSGRAGREATAAG